MDQGSYQNERKQESISNQGRYGENNVAMESVSWTCPNCETVNVEYQCRICGKQRPGDKENIDMAKFQQTKRKRSWTVIAAGFVLILLCIIGFCFANVPAEEKLVEIEAEGKGSGKETAEPAITIKTTQEFVCNHAVLAFHQDENGCVVRIDSYTPDKSELQVYYTFAYEDNVIREICRSSPENKEIIRHSFIYDVGSKTIANHGIRIQRGALDYSEAVGQYNTTVSGLSEGDKIFEEMVYSWDSAIFRVQDGADSHSFDINMSRYGLIKGYAIYDDEQNRLFYSERLNPITEREFFGIQDINGKVDVEYNTEQEFKPHYVFRDETGKAISPASFETIVEDNDYLMGCVRCAQISDNILYVSMYRDRTLFGKAEKIPATIQFYYSNNVEPSEKIKVNVGNRENNTILELVVDMSQVENWSLKNVEKITIHLGGSRSGMDRYIAIDNIR